MGDLGLVRAADGRDVPDPLQGLGARLAQNQANRASQEAGLAAERDARRTALHDLQRNLQDHTPLAWIELVPTGTGGSPRRWDLTAGIPAAGWEGEPGAPFSPERGFGFERDLRTALGGTGTRPEDTWCLIGEPATWTALVPDGVYTLRVGVGADADWDGAVIRATSAGRLIPVFCQNRLAADEHATAEVEVTVTEGRLKLVLGGEPGKHLYASVVGTFIASPRSARGLKIDSPTRTLGFIAEPAAVRINARVPADRAVAGPARQPTRCGKPRLAAPGCDPSCPGHPAWPGEPRAWARLPRSGPSRLASVSGRSAGMRTIPGIPRISPSRSVFHGARGCLAPRLKLRSQVAIHLEAAPPG